MAGQFVELDDLVDEAARGHAQHASTPWGACSVCSTRVPSFFARLLAGAAILPQGRAGAAAPGWRRLQGTWPFCGVLYVRGRGHDLQATIR